MPNLHLLRSRHARIQARLRPESSWRKLSSSCTNAIVVLSLIAIAISGAASAQVTLPYLEDFEGVTADQTANKIPVPGAPDFRLIRSSGSSARMDVDGAGHFHGVNYGTRQAELHRSGNGTLTTTDLILTLDMTNYYVVCNDVTLSFNYLSHNSNHSTGNADTSSPPVAGDATASPPLANDWVFLHGSSSDDWIFAFDHNPGGTTGWLTASIDVDQLLAGQGQDFGSTFEVMFRWYDDFTSEGVVFDNIQLTQTPKACTPPARVSGRVGIDENADGVLAAGDDAFPGPVTLELRDTGGSLVATGQTDSTGAFSFNGLTPATYDLSVIGSSIPIGMLLEPGTDGVGATVNPVSVVATSGATTTVNFGYIGDAVTLPWGEGFESSGGAGYGYLSENYVGGVPQAFFWSENDGGRLRTAAGASFYRSGANAATLDKHPSVSGGSTQGSLVFMFDLSAYTTSDPVVMDFSWMEHGGTFDYGHAIEIRGTASDNWRTVYDWGYETWASTSPGVWNDITAVNLSNVLNTWSQTYSETTQIRFRWIGNSQANSTSANEGVTVDDICIYLQGSGDCNGSPVGNRIWNDLDGDGVDDAGEPGLEGLTVELLDAGSSVIDTTTTDSNGNYSFQVTSTGNYTVRVTPPTGASVTYDLDGGTAHEVDFSVVTVGELHLDKDFGYDFAGSVAGVVFEDRNANGVVDVGESTFSGLTVQLRQGATVHRTATTDGSGQFSWGSVGPATWTVEVTTPPSGTVAVFDPDGAGTAHISTFPLADGATNDTQNFGYRYQRSISGHIWSDENADAVEDGGEPALSGLTVTLKQGGSMLFVTATDGSGNYSFTYLPDGTYSVEVTPPAAGSPTYDPDTGTSGPFDDETQQSVSGSDLTGIDFGYDVQNAIGGYVWADANGDGVRDGGESGVGSVALELQHAGCTPGSDCPTTTSDGVGHYEFLGLSAGVDYTLVVDECTLTAGVRTSTTGNSPYLRTLAPAEVVSDADFGYTNLLPFFESFENAPDQQGSYTSATACIKGAPAFSFEKTNNGRLQLRVSDNWGTQETVIGKDFYRTGQAAATMDSTTNDSVFDQNGLVLNLDLSAYTVSSDTVLLDYSVNSHQDERHRIADGAAGDDIIEMRVGGMPGGAWFEVDDPATPSVVEGDWQSIPAEEGQWADVRNVNLTASLVAYNVANGTSYDFDSGFQVRFRHYDDDTTSTPNRLDGVSFDDIRVHAGTGDGEISGTLWKDWDVPAPWVRARECRAC